MKWFDMMQNTYGNIFIVDGFVVPNPSDFPDDEVYCVCPECSEPILLSDWEFADYKHCCPVCCYEWEF